MKKISLFLISLIILSGCSSVKNQPITLDTEIADQGTTEATQPSPTTQDVSDKGNSVVDIKKDASDLASVARVMITKKEDPFKVLEIYKQMIPVYPAKGKERQDTLRYILDTNLAMVKEGKGQDALRLALELDKLIPKDFYVQNRVIGAYRVLAEEQIGKKNYVGAMDFITTGLKVRFDIDIMHTKLNLLIVMAQDDIKSGKISSAKQKLNEVLFTVDAQDSQPEKDIFVKENTEASKMLATLK